MRRLLMLAVLALLASAPKYAHALSDGTPSTGSFTIGTQANLVAASATGSITVGASTAPTTSLINIGPYTFKVGRDWQQGNTSTNSAANLAAAIDASAAPVSATANNAVITLTAIDVGASYNGLGLSTNDSADFVLSGSHLTGGADNASATINGVKLLQGRDWFATDTASGTATSLAVAVNRSGALAPLIYAAPVAEVVNLSSRLSAQPYSLASSESTDLTPSGATMTGGTAGNTSRFACFLGILPALPSSGYPVGCLAFLSTDASHVYISTAVTGGITYWLAK